MRIVEISLDSVDNVTFLEDEKAPEDNDDMTIDSTMKAIEESVQFSKSKVSKKYQDKQTIAWFHQAAERCGNYDDT